MASQSKKFISQATQLGSEAEAARTRKAGGVTLRALHNFVFYSKTNNTPVQPFPDSCVRSFWKDCRVEGHVAPLTGAARNLVQSGYWGIPYEDLEYATMCIDNVTGLHMEEFKGFRGGAPALYLYTPNYAYVLLGPAPSYEKMWDKVVLEWHGYSGKNPVFFWLNPTLVRPTWWKTKTDWEALRTWYAALLEAQGKDKGHKGTTGEPGDDDDDDQSDRDGDGDSDSDHHGETEGQGEDEAFSGTPVKASQHPKRQARKTQVAANKGPLPTSSTKKGKAKASATMEEEEEGRGGIPTQSGGLPKPLAGKKRKAGAIQASVDVSEAPVSGRTRRGSGSNATPQTSKGSLPQADARTETKRQREDGSSEPSIASEVSTKDPYIEPLPAVPDVVSAAPAAPIPTPDTSTCSPTTSSSNPQCSVLEATPAITYLSTQIAPSRCQGNSTDPVEGQHNKDMGIRDVEMTGVHSLTILEAPILSDLANASPVTAATDTDLLRTGNAAAKTVEKQADSDMDMSSGETTYVKPHRMLPTSPGASTNASSVTPLAPKLPETVNTATQPPSHSSELPIISPFPGSKSAQHLQPSAHPVSISLLCEPEIGSSGTSSHQPLLATTSGDVNPLPGHHTMAQHAVQPVGASHDKVNEKRRAELDRTPDDLEYRPARTGYPMLHGREP